MVSLALGDSPRPLSTIITATEMTGFPQAADIASSTHRSAHGEVAANQLLSGGTALTL